MDTKPSVHTPAGIARQRGAWRRVGGGLLGKIERRGEIAHLRANAGQRLELESTRDELGDRCRIVGRVIDVAAARVGRNDDRRDACVEAAVLEVDDDDVLDLFEAAFRGWRRLLRAAGERQGEAERRRSARD